LRAFDGFQLFRFVSLPLFLFSMFTPRWMSMAYTVRGAFSEELCLIVFLFHFRVLISFRQKILESEALEGGARNPFHIRNRVCLLPSIFLLERWGLASVCGFFTAVVVVVAPQVILVPPPFTVSHLLPSLFNVPGRLFPRTASLSLHAVADFGGSRKHRPFFPFGLHSGCLTLAGPPKNFFPFPWLAEPAVS